MNVTQEIIGIIILIYILIMILILMTEIKSDYKIILIGALWVLMGCTIGFLYPDEFSDFILGEVK